MVMRKGIQTAHMNKSHEKLKTIIFHVQKWEKMSFSKTLTVFLFVLENLFFTDEEKVHFYTQEK